MAPLLLLVYCMIVLSQSYSLTGFSWGASTLPFAGDDIALWFNQTSNEIMLIPDTSVDNVWIFDTLDHTFTSQAPTPTAITCYTLSKTFLGDTLYFGHYISDNIGKYELSTNQYTAPMSPSITMAVDWACLTSDNRYVYVLGGKHSSAVAYFQIFDSSGNKWYTGSSLNVARFMSACEIYQGTIYIFGGEYYSGGLKSIEKIYVGQNTAVLSNIATSSFEKLGASLYKPKSRMATTMCENVDESLIYIIGGYNAYASTEYATIEAFNTDTETIVKMLSMKRARWQTSGICANGYIYVFGGYTKEGWQDLDTWEVSNYLTEAPTAVTSAPTDATVSPTNYPSQTPSASPSGAPTDATVSPTNYPSQTPSASPSGQPSKIPTKAPTDTTKTPSVPPTKASYAPTFPNPTRSPTGITLYPTHVPSTAPTIPPTIGSLAPSKAPLPFQPTVAPFSDLYLAIRYKDKSWASWYSFKFQQTSDYTDIMQNALDAAFKLIYGPSIMYSVDDSWEDLAKEWSRAGIINVDFCRFSDVILNDNCASDDDGANDEEEYVAIAVFDAVANAGLDEYVQYLKEAVRDDTFLAAFGEQMNDLLDESTRRRNLLANNFEVLSIEVSESVNEIFSNTDSVSKDDSSDGENAFIKGNGSMTTVSYVVIAAGVLVIVLLIVGCVFYCKRRSQKRGKPVFADDVEFASSPDDDKNARPDTVGTLFDGGAKKQGIVNDESD